MIQISALVVQLEKKFNSRSTSYEFWKLTKQCGHIFLHAARSHTQSKHSPSIHIFQILPISLCYFSPQYPTAEHPDELHWEVERRYNEFYILENKLTEFHGEFQDNQLPPKRSLFTSKDIGFMQTRRLVS